MVSVKVDPDLGMGYARMSFQGVDRTVEAKVNVDLDENGEIVGIEFFQWPLPGEAARYRHFVTAPMHDSSPKALCGEVLTSPKTEEGPKCPRCEVLVPKGWWMR